MNKIITTSVIALVLGVAALSSAQAQTATTQQPTYEAAPRGVNNWFQPNTSRPVIEGRNVYAAPQRAPNVEPYIANSIEQDARSN